MKKLPFERVLALSPHTDDIEFGCGGTIARLIRQEAEVHTAIFSLCRESVPEEYPKDILLHEMHTAADVLDVHQDNRHVFDYPVRQFSKYRQDILEELVVLKEKVNPDLIFTPTTADIHQDHEVITKESIRAFRYQSILGYELPWNNLTFPNLFAIHLSDEHLNTKLKAVRCYQSQSFRVYANPEFFESLAKMRGTQHKTRYAEVFETIKLNL